ncbi:T9SS type A sorting domain-containing protein [candidate division WOR-3 bacterium]|nr:T9SS type A sorting domain-containing protein [candidate division WOR-3 bacterium]
MTDVYKLVQPLVETPPPMRYKLEIREEETEHSFFDMVSLRTIDHPDDVEIGVNVEDEIIPITTAYTPLSAISSGEDYADVLSNDTSWFEGCEGDIMIVEFGVIEDVEDNELWLNADKSGYPISIEVDREDSWEYITSVFPREKFSTTAVASLSEFIEDGDSFTIRFVWYADHNLKTIRIVQIEEISIEEKMAPLTSAIHSRLGNVKQALLNEDEQYADVLPGDTIRLEFAVTDQIPGWGRSFIFLSNGYYITEGDGGSQTAYSNIPLVHSFSLYPNPVRNIMTIRFGIPKEERVSLKVYDVSGREVKTLVDNRIEAGYHSVRLDGKNLPAGIYFARLVTDNYKTTKKLVLMK